jgi:hypothetical protein
MCGRADDLQRLRSALDHEDVKDDAEPLARARRGGERIEQSATRL